MEGFTPFLKTLPERAEISPSNNPSTPTEQPIKPRAKQNQFVTGLKS